VKGKKAAVSRIVTPEKENVPPAAAPRKETIEPPQQDKPPPQKEMLRVKLEIVEDLMSDHTCENYS
jgi:hypothetical protein